MSVSKKLWVGIAILILLSPIGLVLPEHFKAGSAWGEWSTDEMLKLVGYVPKGLEKLSTLWNSPIPDYAFQGWEEKGFFHLNLAYVLSAAIGILIAAFLTWFIGKFLARKN